MDVVCKEPVEKTEPGDGGELGGAWKAKRSAARERLKKRVGRLERQLSCFFLCPNYWGNFSTVWFLSPVSKTSDFAVLGCIFTECFRWFQYRGAMAHTLKRKWYLILLRSRLGWQAERVDTETAFLTFFPSPHFLQRICTPTLLKTGCGSYGVVAGAKSSS